MLKTFSGQSICVLAWLGALNIILTVFMGKVSPLVYILPRSDFEVTFSVLLKIVFHPPPYVCENCFLIIFILTTDWTWEVTQLCRVISQKLCAGCVTERDIQTFLAIMPVAMLVSICPMLIVYSGYMSIQVSAQRVLSRKFEIEIFWGFC